MYCLQETGRLREWWCWDKEEEEQRTNRRDVSPRGCIRSRKISTSHTESKPCDCASSIFVESFELRSHCHFWSTSRRFCIKRFWTDNVSTPRQRVTTLFHTSLRCYFMSDRGATMWVKSAGCVITTHKNPRSAPRIAWCRVKRCKLRPARRLRVVRFLAILHRLMLELPLKRGCKIARFWFSVTGPLYNHVLADGAHTLAMDK